MSHIRTRAAASAAVLLAACCAPVSAQPVIVLDYTYDTNNFFGSTGSAQRLALEAAATRLTGRLTDSLSAITPNVGAGNTWNAFFNNPGTGAVESVANLTIAANEIRVYAGGRELGGTILGQGGPGGFDLSATTQQFVDSIVGRGQAGALGAAATRTDFGSWGGAITFDSVGTNWNFSVASGPSAGQSDFYSVALHELGHLLGIGTADSWDNLISGTTYNGSRGVALYGTSPALMTTSDKGHFAEGTMFGGQEVAMDPSILVGTRKEFTELDFAGLDDLGWDVSPVPEPAAVLSFAAAGLGGVWVVRRRAELTAAA